MTAKTGDTASPTKVSRLTRGSKILKVIVSAIQDKKGEKVVSLDLRKIPEAVSDFFIVCEATSTVQVKAIADWVEEKVKRECGELPYKHEGHTAGQWVLIDFVNVVVHVFLSETRKFYRLEEMWGDGEAEEELISQDTPETKAPSLRGRKKQSKG